MSIRVLPHASDLRRYRGVGPREATPTDPTGQSPERARRRIRDEARDGLTAAAMSLGGSIALTLALSVLLRWLG
jgi:hypothetical protein